MLKKISNWDEEAARHILSRSMFGYRKADLENALSYSLDHFVDEVILTDFPLPQPPGDWVTVMPDPRDFQANQEKMQETVYWWYDLMFNQETNLREKMVLFLHNHFVSEYAVVEIPHYMYIQNSLFREYSFGNFRELTKKITIDPAMLRYLDGSKNIKSSPNENYGRELLELFTLGIGNYTEKDIVEAARALTGWKIDGLGSLFYPNLFDDGEKEIFGKKGNYNYEELIDLIFEKEECAEFICAKLYAEFVHYEANTEYVKQLAEVFRENNYELKPVLSAMLKSEYFHSEEIRGAKIKSPIEYLISTVKQLGISNIDHKYLFYIAKDLQQILFNPPDVRGWEGQRNWISTNTFPLRNNFADSVITGKKYPQGMLDEKVDSLTYARSFNTSEQADEFVEDVTNELLQYEILESQKNMLLEILLDGAEIYDWSTYDPDAESRIRAFLIALMRLPEFQLS
ncbi:MAG: DUF1800 family protein [Rhodothermaceae bacterium]